MTNKVSREDRRQVPKSDDPTSDRRSEFARDRDRILYSSALRRLAGVTQVVSAGEGHVFHNRLTHTLKVAQLARRLAEGFAARYAEELGSTNESIEPEVVEAAALAHDLGHPPFGHIGEQTLRACVRNAGLPEGYEGNAQSFRIVNRLAEYRAKIQGLDLTRATRAAILKYPWFYNANPRHKSVEKFGAYKSEEQDLSDACANRQNGAPSLEAQIMDHADAVTYSVHDLDDFYRAGLVPLENVCASFAAELDDFAKSDDGRHQKSVDSYATALENWFILLYATDPYRGFSHQRAALQARASQAITKFVQGVSIRFDGAFPQLQVPDECEMQMAFMQHLVRKYVIDHPKLATQQHGQRKIIERLFETYYGEIKAGKRRAERLLPPAFTDQWRELSGPSAISDSNAARLTADVVSSFTDEQAARMDARLSGRAYGAVTDLVD